MSQVDEYKRYRWQVVANDYNSPFVRNYLWTKSFYRYPGLLKVPRVVFGIVSQENKIEYIADLETWTRSHNKLKAKVLKNYRYLEQLIDQSEIWGKKLNQLTEKNIARRNLVALSNRQLLDLLKKFIDWQGKEYAYGTALPILDFQSFSFVENNLKNILQSKVNPADFQKYYAIFTEPNYNSFAQDQEEALLKLMAEFYNNKKWLNSVKTDGIGKIKNNFPGFYNKLKRHTAKWCWVYYVYAGPAFKEENFLDFIKDYLHKNVRPKDKLKEMKAKREDIIKTKQQFIKKLKLNQFQKTIMVLAGKFVWAKPRRKDYQSKSYYHLEKLMTEISRRLFISLDQARSATIEMLEEALVKHKEINLDRLNEIKKFHACLPNHGRVITLIGNDAANFRKNFVKDAAAIKNLSQISEIKGTCACPGRAKGKVKIVNLTADMNKMNYGDILVATATTPNIVAAMKKAAAIITDEGGLTCHAAIVSRELEIPCVIGTKIATKVLKDGDIVEVDAIKGVIKKI